MWHSAANWISGPILYPSLHPRPVFSALSIRHKASNNLKNTFKLRLPFSLAKRRTCSDWSQTSLLVPGKWCVTEQSRPQQIYSVRETNENRRGHPAKGSLGQWMCRSMRIHDWCSKLNLRAMSNIPCLRQWLRHTHSLLLKKNSALQKTKSEMHSN